MRRKPDLRCADLGSDFLGRVYRAGHIQVARHLDCAIRLHFDERSADVLDDNLAVRDGWRLLLITPNPPDDYAVFGITLLRDYKHLIAHRQRRDNAPSRADALRQDGEPPGLYSLGL